MPRSSAQLYWAAFNERLAAPVSLQSLAALRILFGALMTWDMLRYAAKGWITRYYVEPQLLFPFEAFAWARPLPEPYIHYLWLFAAFLAFCMCVGLFFRVASAGFLLIFSYFFVLDKSVYLNHFYMILLYAALLGASPANRLWSLDALIRPHLRADMGPYWPVFALRAQTEIILVYAGLVKITEDWLRLEPLGMWLRESAEWFPFGYLFHQDWVVGVGAYGAIALHLIGAPLLLIRRTRLPVFIAYCGFHMLNAVIFPIGVFPWMMIAVTTVFFAPDWPRQLTRLLRPASRQDAQPPLQPPRMSAGVPALVSVWLAVQVFLPLRAALFKNDVRWSGDGHYFSWRMRIYDRTSYGYFEVMDSASGERERVNPNSFLTKRQMKTVMERPDMILRAAHHVRDRFAAQGRGDVKVHGYFWVSLNGREYQQLVDPAVDLASERLRFFSSDPWVTELTTPLLHWRERGGLWRGEPAEN